LRPRQRVRRQAGVVDGSCTVLEEVEASGFALWCRGRLNKPVSIGGVAVIPGDAVLCDESGVLILPPGEAEAEARAAIESQERGLMTQSRVAKGAKLEAISAATGKVLGSS
jgi:4-hydroxy-4-methyl-2-oxoglutarate aldolase